ncbi:5-formyltetrahydrofolate cyclo-ligase [Paraglaciecola aquimarina]|uniref:5-formyltetrahydrofolate cyclo-ligase n=1 Tax=Paraglaciecola algarum TaxID=3050085 RepID=A0ABS9D9E1_9ALTE|nr:5-formyltetrahydrofolate cyclo-ligase [Paraglaciecola sp. G1-23]MCF2948399.1 5-formyltetrahydrofolate cyclo-ligase [Paraglaciecola sp. G1-23]
MVPFKRKELRQHFRKLRNQLDKEQQNIVAQAALQTCLQTTELSKLKTVACYLANDGELDPSAIIEYCWQHNIQVVLPVLDPNNSGHLVFVEYQANSQMQINTYGIAEPAITQYNQVPLQNIDLVFTPLVAFDQQGNRLGMGGGYYDRTLAPIKRNNLNTQLIGLAHNCQQANKLPTDGWDIPLHGIVTPKQFFKID